MECVPSHPFKLVRPVLTPRFAAGGLANIFGRRPVMLGGLIIFALGSALTGAAQSMAMAIGGRSVQGIGGGAILTMVEIIVCDLVPLAERGAYFGIIGCVWALASAIGPPIGGALASAGQWRWLFYLNLPLCGIAILLVIFFLNVKAPKTTTREKLEQMYF
jgi:MFS family permease